MTQKAAEQFLTDIQARLTEIKSAGLYKNERLITSPQGGRITTTQGRMINLCSNNYLGLSSHPTLIEEGKKALEQFGFGMSSVRFICGTQDIHRQLEQKLSDFLGTEDTILYSSCFDANGGLFETIMSEEDVIISDELNHASIIDGIRLSKAQRLRYRNNDMEDLETQLKAAKTQRYKLIATDGVFSMDGSLAKLREVCDLADRYGAMVMVDDSHAVGFMGAHGRGTHEHCGVMSRIDILTGTLGKALGGASGGYISGRRDVIAYLRQRSRPYLFSNSLAPMITAVSIKVLDLLKEQPAIRQKLHANARHFRQGLERYGFKLLPGEHPIIPLMLGDARLAGTMAEELLKQGVYVVGFSFPVVPKERARIRTQMSAALSTEDLDVAIDAFARVGKALGVIS